MLCLRKKKLQGLLWAEGRELTQRNLLKVKQECGASQLLSKHFQKLFALLLFGFSASCLQESPPSWSEALVQAGCAWHSFTGPKPVIPQIFYLTCVLTNS